MHKLKVHIINYKDVFSSVKIIPNHNHINEYLNGGRQDVLENFDIFTENVRSVDRKFKNFDLFEISNEITDDCIIVVGFYLELLEFWGQRNRIYDVVKYYCEKHPKNKIVVTWNHDINAAQIFNFINNFDNLYVLNFNTSVNHKRFILLPFWSIDEDDAHEDKIYLANLVCDFNNRTRINIRTALRNYPNVFISNKVSFDEYKKILSGSKFTLCPLGLGLSSYRFFECFHLNTIPILFADNVILPYQDKLNYDEFTIRIEEAKSSDGNYIINKINSADYDSMLEKLNSIKEFFTLKGVQEEIYNKLI